MSDLLELINAGLKKEQLEDKDLLELCKEQSLTSFLYPVYKKEEYRKYYLGAALLNDSMDEEIKRITDIFNDHGIRHVLMKGFILKNLYPDTSLRVMGDVDILIDKKNMDKAKDILINLGYKTDIVWTHHIELMKGKKIIELHHCLFGTDISWHQEFDDWKDHIICVANNTYVFDDTYHFLFVFCHFAKHVIKGGAGVRALCDLYLMLETTNIDMDVALERIKRMSLDNFFNTVIEALSIIFGYTSYGFTHNDAINEFLEFVEKSGVHGFGKNNDKIKNQYKASNKSKLGYLLGKLFAPYSAMKEIYPWTKGYVLLPIGYICRFFSLLAKRHEVKEVFNAKNDDFYNNIGL